MVRGWKFLINCTIGVAKTKALISFSYYEADLCLFSPMQVVGFPMQQLIYDRAISRESLFLVFSRLDTKWSIRPQKMARSKTNSDL